MEEGQANTGRQEITPPVGEANGQGGGEGRVAIPVASQMVEGEVPRLGEPFVKVIADSISPQGIRITTFHLRYWRAIHAELMTHRVFSRNARSSRAVPSRVLLTEPIFIPVFGMNKPGMQSDLIAPPDLQMRWRDEWQDLAAICREYVERWSVEGMHKQHANRPLEWFGWIDVLVTSTSWNNFWALRISEYAQPEFDRLAREMKLAMDQSLSRPLQPGEWHLPYIHTDELKLYGLEVCQRLSVARCARLSYRPFDGQDTLEAEDARYNRLVVSSPVHASPAEHQATPDKRIDASYTKMKKAWRWAQPSLHGNLTGWVQYRKTIPNESVPDGF